MKTQRTEKERAFAKSQGKLIFNLRNKRGITRPQLAKFTGITQTMIFRIEMGDSTASSFVLDAIATALDVSRETLYPRPGEVITIPSKVARLMVLVESSAVLRRAYA